VQLGESATLVQLFSANLLEGLPIFNAVALLNTDAWITRTDRNQHSATSVLRLIGASSLQITVETTR